MMPGDTEQIVYLLRKTSMNRTEIGKLSPSEGDAILREVYFQEAVDEWRRQHGVASLLAAIYNTIPRKRGSKACKASDFLQGEMPTRNPENTLEKIAEDKGIRLPSKELKNRG